MNARESTPRRLRDDFASASSGAATALVLAFALTFGGTSAVRALGLGEIVEQSALGEPPRFAIQVIANADDLASDELAPECFKLVPGESLGSGELPQLAFGRAALERNAAGLRVIVTSPKIANDPALSFTVQAGCRLKIRHEYTALLDPPIIREPLVAERAETTAPPRQTDAATGTAAKSSSGVAKDSSRRANARTRSSARGDGGRHAPNLGASAKRSPPASSTATAAKEPTKPRLSVSRSAQDPMAGAGMSDIAQSKSDEEIRHDVEAETVVLQRRIAELSATLERMETELRQATAARETAERTVKASPSAPSGPDPWLVSLALALVALALAAVLIRSRRDARLAMPAFVRAAAETSDDAPTALGSGATVVREVPRRASAAVPSARNDENRMPDDSDTFDEDLLHYAQQTSTYSVLEREQPKVVASVVRDWGNPKVIAYLRDLLVAPRKGSRPFSKEAVSDLIFLQALAMEHAGYGSEESPWQIELDDRRQRTA